MGSVIDYKKCPQCGGLVYNEYYYKSGEENEVCFRCGKWYDRHFPRDEEEAKLTEKGEYVISSGDGLGRCTIHFKSGVGHSFSLAEPYSEDLETWYQEVMKDAEVDPERSYLTRWDPETGQVVVIHGKDPGLYEDEFDEAEGESCSSAENTDM